MQDISLSVVTREQLIDLLNDDLSREVQSVGGYVNSSRIFGSASEFALVDSLKAYAEVELGHAMTLAAQIDTLGGAPVITSLPVSTSDEPVEMLRCGLENEALAIANYQARIVQCEMLGEHTVAESIRQILAQEHDHYSRLASVLGSTQTQQSDPVLAVVRSAV